MKSSISWLLALLAVASAIALSGVSADAATKKKEQPPASPYEMPMRIVVVRNNVPGCEPLCPQWLSAEGQITARTPALFKKALADTRAFRLPVVITSTGGDVDAALAIGEMIRKRHLDVVVGWTYFAGCAPLDKKCKLPKGQTGVYRGIAMSSQAFCVSACSFVLAAGERRLRGEGSFVGVHQISRTITRERVRYYERYSIVNGKKKVLSRQIVSRKPMKSYVSTTLDKRLAKKLDSFFNRMGIDRSLLALFNRAPPTSMYMIAGDELRTTRLITGAAPAVDLVASTPCANTPPAGNCVLLEANAKP